MGWLNKLKRQISSIGTKIILPYLLLTLIVAGVGAFIATTLVTSTLQERFNNQLLDAGRVVSEGMVRFEEERLAVLRAVAGTQGVATGIATHNRQELATLVPPIIANSTTDAVELLDLNGREVYGWQRIPGQSSPNFQERFDADYSQINPVRKVLDGVIDELGDKQVLVSNTPLGMMIFTIGPVYQDGQRVGVVLVGTYIQKIISELHQTAAAHVTLYDQTGTVIATTLGGGQQNIADLVQESPGQYRLVLNLLQQSPTYYHVVSTRANSAVYLGKVRVLNQEYTLAYGDWRLRNQSFGLFSVALPSDFIASTAATSRTLLSLLFSIATIAVFGLGFFIAQRIIQPLNHLVKTALAITQGNLKQRTGIQRSDEIGALAHSFDTMTDNLVERNRQLVEQASKLETILNSIADGVIVLNLQDDIISTNPAARQILVDMSPELQQSMLKDLPAAIHPPSQNVDSSGRPRIPHRRYRVGNRVFSALAAPMQTPNKEKLGTIIALRDVTREAEAEYLQDGFITSISHELRTPLTTVKGYSDLLLTIPNNLNDRQRSMLKDINYNANLLAHHINKLIDISEIQAGTLALNTTPLDLNDIVATVVEKWRPIIEARSLTLTLNIPPQPIMISGDPLRLAWAADNLISNACNYTPAGSITVSVRRENEFARIDVTDTGVGIIAADQPYIFDRFFRANNSHEATFNVDGVGLGLFITRAIINLHAGQVWVKSKVDRGSTFSVRIPIL